MTPQEICKEFISCEVKLVSPLSGGHINETFLIETEDVHYVCQRLNKGMDINALLKNYEMYASACDRFGLVYPVWIKTRNGNRFYTDSDGYRWRMYPYLDGEILSAPLSEEKLRACGHGIARIHMALQTMQDMPQPVYPMLHDLKHYYKEYQKLLESTHLIEDNRNADIEDLITARIGMMLDATKDYSSPSIVHGDMKLANILFRDCEVIGFLDFDTVMTGYVEEDIADCIRSCCITDGIVNRDAANTLISGYTALSEVSPEFPERVWKAFRKICFELGLRYYMDAISEKKHFRVTSPEYRIGKAESLLKMK